MAKFIIIAGTPVSPAVALLSPQATATNNLPQSAFSIGGADEQASSSDKLLRDAASSSDAKLIHDAKSSDDQTSSEKVREDASSSNFQDFYAWNVLDKSANTTLSNTDHTATSTPSANGGVRATHGRNSGRRYFELHVTDANSINQFNIYGLATITNPLDATGYGGSSTFRGVILGEYGGGGHFDLGAVTIRFAVDLNRNEFMAATSNTGAETWFGPFTLGAHAQTWFPFFGWEDPGSSFPGHTGQCTINMGDSPFTYSVPTGFVSWNGLQGVDSGSQNPIDSIIVAVGDPSGVSPSTTEAAMRTIDGVSWSLETTPDKDGTAFGYVGVCHSFELNLFVAVAPKANVNDITRQVMTSPDGITWTARTAAENNEWADVCWSPDLRLFVAVGSLGTGTHEIMTSPDGITWTARTAGSAGLSRVIWNAALQLFMANGSDILYSSDGITWNAATGSTMAGNAIACNDDGRTVSLGFGGIGNNVAYSDDGMSWTQSGTSVIAHDGWSSACWASELGLFVAVSNGRGSGTSHFATSSDGITWTATAFAGTTDMTSVCWSRALQIFIAVGTMTDGYILTSPDGTNWTPVTPPDTFAWNAVVEGIIRHESPSSEFESEVQSLERVSSDKLVHDQQSSSDVKAASDERERQAESSSDKLVHDAKSSDDLVSSRFFADQASSSNEQLSSEIHSDKLIHDQMSSSDKPENDAESSSNKIINDAQSSEFQSDERHAQPPPIQVVVTITT